jgi:hypothetical protein
MRNRIRTWLWTWVLLWSATALAHVGSPDVYYDGDAGPYHLLVTVRSPAMIPGVAQVEVRVTSGTVSSIQIVPLYVTGKDQGFPPTPDVMQTVPGDPQSYTGKVWLMESGSWQVRVDVSGVQGPAKLAVPVAAFARRTLPMQKALGALLFALMVFLGVGIVSIAWAAAREGSIELGATPDVRNTRKGRIAMVVATVLVLGMLFLGNWWWDAEASAQKHNMLYQAPPLAASLENGRHLVLKMGSSYWHDLRKDAWSMKLIPDHGHLMHLFLLRVPAMDRFYHLHPDQTQDGVFALDLPSIDAGHYRIFADVVRATGFPDTMMTEMEFQQNAGVALAGDDSEVTATSFGDSSSNAISPLADGGHMVWERESSAPVIGRLTWFRFKVEDKDGKPVNDLEPYMGMAGHAVFVRSDESVFAHVHPAGSVPMAALQLAQNEGNAVSEHNMPMTLPSEVSFPYGFPRAGDYRLFVQIKRNGKVETGVFDTRVGN